MLIRYCNFSYYIVHSDIFYCNLFAVALTFFFLDLLICFAVTDQKCIIFFTQGVTLLKLIYFKLTLSYDSKRLSVFNVMSEVLGKHITQFWKKYVSQHYRIYPLLYYSNNCSIHYLIDYFLITNNLNTIFKFMGILIMHF